MFTSIKLIVFKKGLQESNVITIFFFFILANNHFIKLK